METTGRVGLAVVGLLVGAFDVDVRLLEVGGAVLLVEAPAVGADEVGRVVERPGVERAVLTTADVLGMLTIDPPGVRATLEGVAVFSEVHPASRVAARTAPAPACDNRRRLDM
ncbi:hypothetical protein [Nakamurella panacisegetis]|uniref:hypothetical protein n=1 Tax=Nakamurella panacisegetis TaxID=1090615 RepID=UPI000B80C919|nr:hypothetical protein [Nakamurella panacisegetis]